MQTKNVDRTRLQSIIAIIKLVGEKGATTESEFANLLSTVAAIEKYFANRPELAAVIKELDDKIRTIISDNLKARSFAYALADFILTIQWN